MTKVIENWVQMKTGKYVKLDIEDVGKWFYDGVVYFKLLEISLTEIKGVSTPSSGVGKQEAFKNLQNLCPLLKLLGVTHDQSFLKQVASKSRGECLRLLYELYLKLEDKDNIYFITKQREEFLFKKPEGRFEIEPGVEPTIPQPEKEIQILELPLIASKHLVSRYKTLCRNRKAQDEIKKLNREKKVKYREKEDEICKPLTRFMDQPDGVFKQKNSSQSLEELQFKHTKKDEYSNWSPADQIKYMKQKNKTTSTSYKLKIKMISLMIHDLWHGVYKNQETGFTDEIKNLLLRQCDYEKKLILRLNRLYNAYKALLNQKMCIERDFKSKVPDRFAKTAEWKNEEIGLEKARLLELHCRMQKEISDQIKNGEKEMCAQIVNDICDFSTAMSEYEAVNGTMAESFVKDWKELFYKEIPIDISFLNQSKDKLLNDSFTSENLDDFPSSYSVNDISKEEPNDTNEYLGKISIQNYLTCSGEWSIDDEGDILKPDENLNITGFIVHRILEKKYPLPALPRPSSCPKFDVRVILSNVHNPGVIQTISEMLEKHSISVINVNTAVNYCLEMYIKEKHLSEFGVYLRENQQSEDYIEIGKDKSVSVQQINYDKSDPLVNEYKYPNKHKTKDKIITSEKIVLSHKKTQWPQIKKTFADSGHTYTAFLGKVIFETLNKGEVLNEVLLAKAILENIKSLTNKKGFVLIGYPANFNQAALLEFLITGKVVPSDVREPGYKENIDLFHTEIPFTSNRIDVTILNDFNIFLSKFAEKKVRLIQSGLDQLEEEDNEFINKAEYFSSEQFGESPSERVIHTEPSVISYKLKTKGNFSSKIKIGPAPVINSELVRKIEYTDSASTVEEISQPLSTLSKAIPTDQLYELRKSKIVPDPQKTEESIEVTSSYFHKIFVLRNQYVKYMKPSGYCQALKKYGMKFAKEINETDINHEVDYFADYKLSPEDFYKSITSVQPVISNHLSSKALQKLVNLILDKELLNFEESSRDMLTHNRNQILFPINLSSITEPFNTKQNNKSVSEQTQRIPSCVREKIEFIPSSEWVTYLDDKDEMEYEIKMPNERSRTLLEEKLESEELSKNIMKPGNEGWSYMKEPTLLALDVALATLWEAIEKNYLLGLEKGLTQQRKLKNIVMPYRNAIRTIKNKCLQSQDERTNLVVNFQQMLNDVDMDFRKKAEVKNELHCRVYELKLILQDLASEKKKISNMKRNEQLCDAWVTDYVFSVANSYLYMIQVELDRFVETVQLLNDRYTNMLRCPPDIRHIPRAFIKKVSPLEEEFSNSSLRRRKFKKEGKLSLSGKKSDGVEMVDMGDTTLVNFDERSGDFGVNPSHVLLSTGDNAVASKVKSVLSHYKSISQNEALGKDMRKPIEKKKDKKGDRRPTKYASRPKSIQGSKTQLKRDSETKSFKKNAGSPERGGYEIKDLKDLDLVDKIKWEWDLAVQKEIDRLNFRTKLITLKGEAEIDEAVDLIVSMFLEFDTETEESYQKELDCIDQVGSVFQAAIEDCTPIQPLLVLDSNNFFIDQTNLLFPNQPPPPPPRLEEETGEFEFKIEQLERIISKLSHITKNHIIEAGLVSVFNNIIKENQIDYLPPGWMKLTEYDVKLVFKEAFGDVGVINWKSFISQVINVPLPTIDELLALKQCYMQYDVNGSETINWNQFVEIPLWFDNDFGKTIKDDLHLSLAKDLLFNLFQVNKFEMNYTNMLFSFCQGLQSLEGFIKALLLLDGDHNLQDGAKCFIDLSQSAEARAVAKEFLKETFQNTFHELEHVIVKTIPSFNYNYLYDSDINEYLVTEKLLASHYKRKVLSDSSKSDSIHSEEKLEESRDMIFSEDDMHKHPIWQKCVRYDFVLSVLLFALNFHSFSTDHFHWHLDIQNRLKLLFETKGKADLIKVHILAESDVLQDIFKRTSIFKSFNIVNFVEKHLTEKAETEQTTVENKKLLTD